MGVFGVVAGDMLIIAFISLSLIVPLISSIIPVMPSLGTETQKLISSEDFSPFLKWDATTEIQVDSVSPIFQGQQIRIQYRQFVGDCRARPHKSRCCVRGFSGCAMLFVPYLDCQRYSPLPSSMAQMSSFLRLPDPSFLQPRFQSPFNTSLA
ncbi:hypothetical protein BLNAU_14515 [Blattamonas nauphoetae]|uniref:Uncharacterized protein n=1 Tax=Blattamonas nauphoetae TaxID=2049346 RepID=A0ABQ9XGQ5_9EUKA|nr:hypothetical protein BLNAU_14515 [Blattamonas nauphoetae]